MIDPIQAAREYRRTEKDATYKQAVTHARSISSDVGFVKTFLAEWFKIGADHTSFSGDVERIWPKEKYG